VTPHTPSPEQLEAVVRRAQAGDDQAFTRLVELCRGLVYRWALVRTADPDDAEDVAQDVLVLLRRTLASYDGRSRFTTWLYRVTANAAGGFWRKWSRGRPRFQSTGPHPPSQEQLSEPAAEADDPVDRLHRADLVDRVMAAFRLLPRKQREVFDLVDLQGFAPTEVAQMLETNPVTVRAHLCKARRAVRRRLLAQDPDLRDELES
jgi:RNA polymerase sigma-70 factor (ECF subfamily)